MLEKHNFFCRASSGTKEKAEKLKKEQEQKEEDPRGCWRNTIFFAGQARVPSIHSLSACTGLCG